MKTAFTRKSKLPDIPAALEEHATWVDFQRQLRRAQNATRELRDAIAALEVDRATVAAELSEARVAAALGERASAATDVAAIRDRLDGIEARLREAQDDLDAHAEASRRIAQREPQIRAAVGQEIRGEVQRVYRALCEEFAAALLALGPVNEQLLALRGRHGALLPPGAVWFDELSPRTINGMPNKSRLFLDSTQGVAV